MTRPISRREFAKRASSLAVVPAAMTLAGAPAVEGRSVSRDDGATGPQPAPRWDGYADAMVIDCLAAERQRLGIGAPRENELNFVPELNTPRRMEQIGDALLARGHTETRVEKIIGGNWERYFKDVWGDQVP